jgi:hypothetical protein
MAYRTHVIACSRATFFAVGHTVRSMLHVTTFVALLSALAIASCGGDDDCCTHHGTDAPRDTPSDTLDVCATTGRDKIKFSRAQSCANDGAVEWCVPDGDTQLMAALTAISSEITCAPGGGRAGCNTGGRLLCSQPTRFPDHCLTQHGEMTPQVWDDICEVAAQPAITEIVHTIFE